MCGGLTVKDEPSRVGKRTHFKRGLRRLNSPLI